MIGKGMVKKTKKGATSTNILVGQKVWIINSISYILFADKKLSVALFELHFNCYLVKIMLKL